MAITVKHSKVSTIPDDADTSLVRPSDWNADHTLVGLGTMAEQNANNVNITGGSITGVSGLGTVTSVGGTGSVNGITLSGTVTSSGNLTLGGTLGSIANSQLTNSAITINGTSTSLGGSASVGTVTSVAATVPAFLSVTGSPITSSGTLAIAYSGTALPVANGGTGGTTATAGFNALAPSQTSNSGKYLTTDGTNASWATVSGGITGFTSGENTTAPNATVYVDFLQASAAVTNADVAFVAKGTGATLAQVPTSTAAGGNKRGNFATDLQKTRTSASQVASAVNSFIGGGQKNTADGLNSVVVGGNENYALATGSVACGGLQNVSMGLYTFVGGGSTNNADADYSSVIGGINNYANSIGSVALNGNSSFTRAIVGNIVLGSYAPIAASYGNSQGAVLILGAQTTNATATILRSNTSAASATNQVTLPNNSAYFFTGEVISGVTGGGDTKGWTIEGVIKRGANAASTTLVGSTVVSTFGDAGAATWTIALAANTTTGSLNVTFTGQAATTIRTVAQIRTTEMAY
jgi:hypothetical protein